MGSFVFYYTYKKNKADFLIFTELFARSTTAVKLQATALQNIFLYTTQLGNALFH